MKVYLFLLIIIGISIGCSSAIKNSDLLPKDVSLMPIRDRTSEDFLIVEARNLKKLNDSIHKIASSKYCTLADAWRISPNGSKPCGGPKEYLAYHKEVEDVIIPLIQDFTRREAHYNILAGLTSDCTIEPQPSGVICLNGKPVLMKGKSPSVPQPE